MCEICFRKRNHLSTIPERIQQYRCPKCNKYEISGRWSEMNNDNLADLRIRENGKIIIEDNCKIENDCRLVSARDGTIILSEGSTLTVGAIINGGSDVIIGKNCVIGPRAIINANDHKFEGKAPIKDQGFIHEKVVIEEDCWFGANVVVNKGVTIRKGSVIGACSLVTKNTDEYSINFGVPTKKIKSRV